MAYLPGFRHDVFVSYAHGDFDQTGTSLLKGWSLEFKDRLEEELRYAFESINLDPSELSIFIDESKQTDQGLDKNGPLTQELRAAASGAALLLVLMSPRYLNSPWCRDELAWWHEQTKKTRAFPEVRNRILVARIWPTGDRPWPEVLCDERGYKISSLDAGFMSDRGTNVPGHSDGPTSSE
jgi:hypothetical protein